MANLGIEVSQTIVASISLRGECESSGDLDLAEILLASARETGFTGRKSKRFLRATLTVAGGADFLAFRDELKQALNSMFRGPLGKYTQAIEEHDPEWWVEVELRDSIEDVSQQRPDASPDDEKTALPVEGDTFPVLEVVDEVPSHTAATAEVEWSPQSADESSHDPSLVDATGQDEQWTDEHIHGTIVHISPSDIAEKPTSLTEAIEALQAGLAREREERHQEQMETVLRIAALQDELRRVTQRLFRNPEALTRYSPPSTPGGVAHVPVGLQRPLEVRIDEVEATLVEATSQVAKLAGRATADSSPIQDDLPENLRAVLQAILELPEGDFAEAERITSTLEGPMTEGFVNSLKNVLRKKKWRVICEKCNKPSMINWHPNGSNERYGQGGRGEFTHSSPSPHCSLTALRKFSFVKFVDKRNRDK